MIIRDERMVGNTASGAWRARRSPSVAELRDDHAVCPVGHALDVVSGRWATLIVHHLLDRELRFGEIRAGLGGINPKTLTEQLRQLEADGIVTRTAHAEIPPRVVYALTPRGRGLEPVIGALAAWGSADLESTASPR